MTTDERYEKFVEESVNEYRDQLEAIKDKSDGFFDAADSVAAYDLLEDFENRVKDHNANGKAAMNMRSQFYEIIVDNNLHQDNAFFDYDMAHIEGVVLPDLDEAKKLDEEEMRSRRDQVALHHLLSEVVNVSHKDFSGLHVVDDFFDKNLTDCDMHGMVFAGNSVEYCNFTGANMNGVIMQATDRGRTTIYDSTLDGVLFVGADLSGADFQMCSFKNCDFTNANLSGVTFDDIGLEQFDGCIFAGANLEGSTLADAFDTTSVDAVEVAKPVEPVLLDELAGEIGRATEETGPKHMAHNLLAEF